MRSRIPEFIEACKKFHNHETSKTNCGESIFQKLPIYVKETLTCKCTNPSEYINLPPPHDFLLMCADCGLAHRYSITYIVQTCEGCDKYYVPRPSDYRDNWQRGQSAVRYRLCAECAGPVDAAKQRSAKRTIGYHFS